jgi:adenylate cyclase
VYERPPSERPSHDTLEGIAAWLIGPARQIASAPQAFDEYAWRLYAAGLPVLRVTLHCGTLHPQFLGSAYVWWRNTAQTQEIMVMHEVVDVVPYAENLVARVRTGGETVRRRLNGAEARLDFPILHDIKAQGGTEYSAFRWPAPTAPTWRAIQPNSRMVSLKSKSRNCAPSANGCPFLPTRTSSGRSPRTC